MLSEIDALIDRLPKPILILGASGFIGTNLFYKLSERTDEVFGTYSSDHPWRLETANVLHAVRHDKVLSKSTRRNEVFTEGLRSQ